MSVARKWVFPIIRLVLIAAVAVALTKLAFFPDGAEAADPTQPTGTIAEPQVPVAIGTITNDVTLPGTVNADAAVPVRAVAAGTVDEVFFTAGQAVAQGDKLYDIKVETVKEPVESTDPQGNPVITQPKPVVTFEKVYAPSAGILSSLTVIHGQTVSVGDVTGQVAPPTFSVSGSLSADQQYRLVNQPTEASVAIKNGPAPFTCTGLTVSTPLAGADSGTGGSPDGASTGGGSSTSVRCAVPADVRVFPGLAAQITIAGGKAENVLMVPTTAVKGSADTGVVWVALGDGATEERAVTLGLNDGTNVQIVEGLREGDVVNQFVPGASPNVPAGCEQLPDGAVMCPEGTK